MKNRLVIIIVIILAVVATGVIGGVIGNLWGKEFTIGRDDKFDIFTSLLVSLLTVLGLAFGSLGIAAYNRLIDDLRKQSNKLKETIEADLQLSMGEQAQRFSRGIDYRGVNIQYYLGIMYYEMAIAAINERSDEALANANFSQAVILLSNALSTAESYLPGYMEDEYERELVLDTKNSLAMTYARIGDRKNTREAHRLANDVLPWGNGELGSVWEYSETSPYVKLRLPRNNGGREEALVEIR